MSLGKNVFYVIKLNPESYDNLTSSSLSAYMFNWFCFLIGLIFFRFLDKNRTSNPNILNAEGREIAIVFKGGGYGTNLPPPVSDPIFDVDDYLDRIFSFSMRRIYVLALCCKRVWREGESVCRFFDWRVALRCGTFIATGIELACNVRDHEFFVENRPVKFFRVERIHPGLIFGFQLCQIRAIGYHLARRTSRLNEQCDLTIFCGTQYSSYEGGLVARTYANRYRPNFRVKVSRALLGGYIGFVLVPQNKENHKLNKNFRYFQSCVNGAFFSCLREGVGSIVVKARDRSDAELAISCLKPRIKTALFNKETNVFIEDDFIRLRMIAKFRKNRQLFWFGQGSSLALLINCRAPSSVSYFRCNRFYPKGYGSTRSKK